MVLLVSLLVVSPLVLMGSEVLRNHEKLSVVCCCMLAAITVPLYLFSAAVELPFALTVLIGLLTKGGLAGVLFFFVMFAGAVPERSTFRKRILPIRGQLSIMASILALGHAAAFGSTHFVRLFTSASELRIWTLLATLAALILIILLFPLFLSSLRAIRRKMKAQSWKRLQKLAYLFYALIYLHILLFHMQGVREAKLQSILNVCLYSIVFFTYSSMRLCKVAQKRGCEDCILFIQFACFSMLTALLVFCFLPTVDSGKAHNMGSSISYDDIPQKEWADGTYKGAAIGYNGRLKVSVVIEGGKIKEVTLKSHVEDEPYVSRATTGILPAMSKYNTPDIDAVSTATTTFEALVEAVHQAIDAAEIQP